MKKNGFTLIELLAVVVILGLIFMFIAPKLSSLIKEGENTSIAIIEGKVIDSAKEYALSNKNFFDTFINVGDEKIVYKDDLLNSGLINSKDIEKLDDFVGVKVELLDEDEFNYVVMYGKNY